MPSASRVAAAFAAVAIAATVVVRLGLPQALPVAHLFAALAVSMLVPGLGRLAPPWSLSPLFAGASTQLEDAARQGQ